MLRALHGSLNSTGLLMSILDVMYPCSDLCVYFLNQNKFSVSIFAFSSMRGYCGNALPFLSSGQKQTPFIRWVLYKSARVNYVCAASERED